MKTYGRTTIHEFLGDLIVYRNLVPQDPRLPSLAEIGPQVGIPAGATPRKSESNYARVVARMLQEARRLEAPKTTLAHLVYIGDTHLNDGTAFANLCKAGGWPGLAFIGAEDERPAQVKIIEQGEGLLYLANRWEALEDFERFCMMHDFPLDARTAMVVDLDKTALGARGRNDHVINRARVEAVRNTVEGLLGESFDPEGFQTAYDTLNQSEFHTFTTDNQDYLAYICLIVGSGLYQLDILVADIREGKMQSFTQFIEEVEAHQAALSPNLRDIHGVVYARAQQGDPTPFKAFRYNEYRSTVARMGCLDDAAPVNERLAQEIVITEEVRAMALKWRARGALLFGLSDKPDEASVPTAALAAQGYAPIHRTETHVVGGRG